MRSGGAGGHSRKMEQQGGGHELDNTWHIRGRDCSEWPEYLGKERVLPNVIEEQAGPAPAGLIGHGKECGFYSVCNDRSVKGFH